MDQDQLRNYLNENRAFISLRAIAQEIGMDVSNFHKFADGKINLKPDLMPKLTEIIEGLCPKKDNA